jgi:hypothetical protein
MPQPELEEGGGGPLYQLPTTGNSVQQREFTKTSPILLEILKDHLTIVASPFPTPFFKNY